MATASSLSTNDRRWFRYLKLQSRSFLRANCPYSNCLSQRVAEIYGSRRGNLDVVLPRVETGSGSVSLELFDEAKLSEFLSRLTITCNTPHFIYSDVCGRPRARRIVEVVCSILRNEEFTCHLERANCACALPLPWISIKELMGLVVIAAAAGGVHFADCSLHESRFGLKSPIRL